MSRAASEEQKKELKLQAKHKLHEEIQKLQRKIEEREAMLQQYQQYAGNWIGFSRASMTDTIAAKSFYQTLPRRTGRLKRRKAKDGLLVQQRRWKLALLSVRGGLIRQ